MTPVPVHPESDSQKIFERVLEPLTESILKPIIKRKLRVSLRPNDTSRDNQDALELLGDIQVALLVELSNKGSVTDDQIRDLKSYAAAVAANACYQYFRSKHPLRTQQKNKIRYFLTHDSRFAVWRDRGSGTWIGGYAEWENTEYRMIDLGSTRMPPSVWSKGMNERDILSLIIRSLFDQLGSPVPIEQLTSYVMMERGLNDRVEVSDDWDRWPTSLECALSSRVQNPAAATEEIAVLRDLWKGILQLSLKHRTALLLNLKDSEGQGLISLFPATGAASIAEIASALDFSQERFTEIWNTLPWSDLSIAEHLRLSRQQVINLRQSARARLARLCRGPRQY